MTLELLVPQTLGQAVEPLWQSCDRIQDPLFIFLLQPSLASLSKLVRMPHRLLLPEHFTESREVFSVHAVQHNIQHLLDAAPWCWPGDVTVAQPGAACWGACMEGRSTALLIPALLRLPGLLLFPCSTFQILFVLLLQPLGVFYFVSLLFAFLFCPSRRMCCSSLSFCVLFMIVFSSDTICPIPKVFLIFIIIKKITCCEKSRKY